MMPMIWSVSIYLEGLGRCSHCGYWTQWDLGEFDQKEGIATRWGTKAELVDAIAVAKQHGVQVLIDAVLNVRLQPCHIYSWDLTNCLQHKIGADTTEQYGFSCSELFWELLIAFKVHGCSGGPLRS